MSVDPITPNHLSELREKIQELAESRLSAFVNETETTGSIPPAALAAMSEAGCFGRGLPVEFGGTGEGLRAFSIQQEELARVWPTAAVAATWTNLSGILLTKFGTPAQQAELLAAIATGRSMGAVAWTEPHGGSDAASLRTTAVRVEGGWLLSGSKRLIDNAAKADFIIVGARSDPDGPPRRAMSMFVVRRDNPGFHFGGTYETLGLKGAGVGHFTLQNCFIPDADVFGDIGRGFYQMMAMVEFGRTGVAAMCVGIAQRALDSAVEFLTERVSFGRKLSDNDVILAAIADMRIKLDGARMLTERAATMFDAGERCTVEAAVAKVFASEVAIDTTACALHLHGGIGFTSEVPIERFFRDCQAFTIGEGTSEVLRMVIGRHEFARSRPTK